MRHGVGCCALTCTAPIAGCAAPGLSAQGFHVLYLFPREGRMACRAAGHPLLLPDERTFRQAGGPLTKPAASGTKLLPVARQGVSFPLGQAMLPPDGVFAGLSRVCVFAQAHGSQFLLTRWCGGTRCITGQGTIPLHSSSEMVFGMHQFMGQGNEGFVGVRSFRRDALTAEIRFRRVLVPGNLGCRATCFEPAASTGVLHDGTIVLMLPGVFSQLVLLPWRESGRCDRSNVGTCFYDGHHLFSCGQTLDLLEKAPAARAFVDFLQGFDDVVSESGGAVCSDADAWVLFHGVTFGVC